MFAQSGDYTLGARSAAMGTASSTLSDSYSTFNNPAGLAGLSETSIFASYENRFLLEDFQMMGAGAVVGVAFVLVLFLCVLLHEFGHAFAARAFGIRTPDITLLPIGGVARLERMPRSPLQELVIAIAGPAVNVAIAIALLPLAISDFGPRDFEDFSTARGSFAGKLLAVNVMLVLFNLIPAFPMDGGRILRSLLALAIPHTSATHIAARVGQGIAVLFAIAGLFGNPFLLIIGLFIFLGAQQELQSVLMAERFGGLHVSDLMQSQFETCPAGLSPERAREFASQRIQPIFPVVDSDLRVLGTLSRDALLSGALVPRGVPLIPSSLPAVRALTMLQASGEPLLPVVNSSGQIVGVISVSALTGRG